MYSSFGKLFAKTRFSNRLAALVAFDRAQVPAWVGIRRSGVPKPVGRRSAKGGNYLIN
jgi:hypothetical protein